MEIDTAVAEAQEVVDEGITTLKVKVGIDAARDVSIVRKVRKAVGAEARIRVDANQGYRSWKEALRVTGGCRNSTSGTWSSRSKGSRTWPGSRQRTDVPIMADESAWTADDVLPIIDCGRAEMISVYYTKPGGL